jgi:excisionase family DNA binding protein
MSFDIQLYTITEKLERIEQKIDNRLLKNWFSISDVITTTGLSRSTINRAIAVGSLKSVKNGGKRMFKRDWIERWIQG